LAALLFEKSINGYVARRRGLTGTDQGTTVFQDESFIATAVISKTKFLYDKVNWLDETDGYFEFSYDKSFAQACDKSKLSGSTVEEFRKFITEKAGKAAEKLSK
jgi:hypothetical protein